MVKEVGGSVKILSPAASRKGSLEQQGRNWALIPC
jgi:hypothetical protein